MVSLRDYDIYLLFLLLAKFHGSGECEVILPYKGFDSIFFTMCHFKLRYRKRQPDPRLLSTVFVFQNLDMMLGFQSRDK